MTEGLLHHPFFPTPPSSGRKLPNKWDTYDVEGEMARLDAEEEEGGEASVGTAKMGAGGGVATLGQVKTELGRLNHDLERLMGCLDQVEMGEVLAVPSLMCVCVCMCVCMRLCGDISARVRKD